MSEHLEKAKAALKGAGEMADNGSVFDSRQFDRLLTIASAQAQVAQAEALEGIAQGLKELARMGAR